MVVKQNRNYSEKKRIADNPMNIFITRIFRMLFFLSIFYFICFLTPLEARNRQQKKNLQNHCQNNDKLISTDLPAYVPGRLLVKFKSDPGTNIRYRQDSSLEDLYQTSGLEYIEPLYPTNTPKTRYKSSHPSHNKNNGLYLLHFGEDAPIKDLVNLFNSHPAVEFAEPDFIIHIDLESLCPNTSALNIGTTTTPKTSTTNLNDPYFHQLWGLDNTIGSNDADIRALDAWSFTTGNPNVVVAIIDTGVDYTHQDLAANIWTNVNEIPNNGVDDDGNGYIDDYYGYDFFHDYPDPMDENGHGTHCSGTIAAQANNGIGIVGVNWQAKIMCIRWLDEDGLGTLSSVCNSINYAVMMGADIINASWWCYDNASMKEEIRKAKEAGILFVAAAGNDSLDLDINLNNPRRYPACYDLSNIISVAATDEHDDLWFRSNFGSIYVDIGAPGVNIYSTVPGDSYEFYNGTSMAAPHVSGVAALIKAQYPEISLPVLKNAILNSSDQIASLNGITVTGGRLNAFASLAGIDVYPPGQIQDLTTDLIKEGNSIVLTWTVPGDDGYEGRPVDHYKIIYSEQAISDENPNLAHITLNSLHPKQCGEREKINILPLIKQMTNGRQVQNLRIAIKAIDIAGNESKMSNSIEISLATMIIFEDDMEHGDEKWEIIESLWHLETARSIGKISWAYNGGAEDYNYDTNTSNRGGLISNPIELSQVGEFENNYYLSWWHWSETEYYEDESYDLQEVYIHDGEEEILLWHWDSKNKNIEPWRQEIIDISEFAGRTITIQFLFDTADDSYNNFEGWYIDNIQIYAQFITFPPVCSLESPPGELIEGTTYSFSASNSYDLTGLPLLYEWDFGDGETSTEIQPNHTFSSEGNYTVILQVKNNYNKRSTDSIIIEVIDKNPKATFVAIKENNSTFQFKDKSVSYDGITSRQWNFGDGETSSDIIPKHTYASSGTYNVKLTITENDEDISDYSFTIKIKNNPSYLSPWLYSQTLFPGPWWDFNSCISHWPLGNNNQYNFVGLNDWAGNYYTGYWPLTYYDLYNLIDINTINPNYADLRFLQVFTPSQPYNNIFYFSDQTIGWPAFAALSL